LFNSITAILLAARASVIINVVFVVAFFASVDNTITAEGVFAVRSAGVGGSIASVGSSITLFTTKGIDNTITTEVQLAIHTASVGSSIAVTVIDSCGEFDGISVVASFVEVGIDLSVTASEGAVLEAQPGVNTTRVAIFTKVDDPVTARGRAAWRN